MTQQSPQSPSLEYVSPHRQVAATHLLGGDREDISLSGVQEETCTETGLAAAGQAMKEVINIGTLVTEHFC